MVKVDKAYRGKAKEPVPQWEWLEGYTVIITSGIYEGKTGIIHKYLQGFKKVTVKLSGNDLSMVTVPLKDLSLK